MSIGNPILMSKPKIILILWSISVFSFACNTAAPPRPVDGSAASTARARERAIALVENVEIEKLDGQTFKLADFRGKLLVVDFWATYCPPCVKQVPQLASLSKQYRDKGLEVIGLTSDEKSDQSKVIEFLNKAGADYTIGYEDRKLASAFLKGTEDDTGRPPIPQLFVISPEGRVIEHLIGEDPQRGVRYLERVISQNLNGASK